MRYARSFAILTLFGLAHGAWADGVCKTYDRSKPCCPHSPPQCCAPQLRQLVSVAEIASTCHAKVLGEASSVDSCDTFFGEDIVARVSVGQQPAEPQLMAKLRKMSQELGDRVTPLHVPGAQDAFSASHLDDRGVTTQVTAWALVGSTIVRIETEAGCVPETASLLRLAVRRMGRLARRDP
jgi:hypothetical protein